MKRRLLIMWVVAALVLVVTNVLIFQKERLLAAPQGILLELAPVDPRSLMQGDYMALRFRATADAFGFRVEPGQQPADGRLVLKVDEHSVGRFMRIDNGQALASDEIAVQYRVRNRQPKVATDAFFFQEGHAAMYQRARYGEFRVAADGEAILTGLRDDKYELLGPGR